MIFLARRLGRFTNILFFAAGLLVLAGWLQLLDFAPYVFLFLSPVAIVVFCASVALLFGILFVPAYESDDMELTREQAPRLWQMWSELDDASPGVKTLHVDARLNASIFEGRRWFGLFGRRTVLTFGYELMLLADEQMLRTVLAHEVGHAALQHTSGATNLAEFLSTFDTLFAFADPDETVVGKLAELTLGAWLRRANGELMRISRRNELEADLFASRLCGQEAAADLELFMAAVTKAVEKEIHEPLEKEILSAIRVPSPPFERVEAQRQALVSAQTQEKYLPLAWEDKTDATSSHPSFKERFENVAPNGILRPVSVAEPAAFTCLSDKTRQALLQRFAERWARRVEPQIGIE